MSFVCPACGWEVESPAGPPPHECVRCRGNDGRAVYLQDRTLGRTVTVGCACGFSFAVLASFAGTSRPCPRCGSRCPVPETPAAAPPNPPPDKSRVVPPGVEKARRRAVEASVRTISSGGRGRIRAVSGCLVVVAAGLTAVAVATAVNELVAGRPQNALGTLPALLPAALLAGAGWWVRSAAYHDVWQFNQHDRTVTHLRRRLRGETVVEEFPFAAVAAVTLTKSASDDHLYSVDLTLHSGGAAFVSNDRGHADELATLLGVPKREG